MWSGGAMRRPSSRPGRRLWRGELLLATRRAVRSKAASAPARHLRSAPLTIPLVCGDSHGFRRVSRGGEARVRRQTEARQVGSASRSMGRRWGWCASRARHRGVPERARGPERCHALGAAVDRCRDAPAEAQRAERAADGGIVDVWPARAASPHVLRMHAQYTWLASPPIMPTTACHQSNDVERYHRFMGRLRILGQTGQASPRPV
jgi:hypothetical protein